MNQTNGIMQSLLDSYCPLSKSAVCRTLLSMFSLRSPPLMHRIYHQLLGPTDWQWFRLLTGQFMIAPAFQSHNVFCWPLSLLLLPTRLSFMEFTGDRIPNHPHKQTVNVIPLYISPLIHHRHWKTTTDWLQMENGIYWGWTIRHLWGAVDDFLNFYRKFKKWLIFSLPMFWCSFLIHEIVYVKQTSQTYIGKPYL